MVYTLLLFLYHIFFVKILQSIDITFEENFSALFPLKYTINKYHLKSEESSRRGFGNPGNLSNENIPLEKKKEKLVLN